MFEQEIQQGHQAALAAEAARYKKQLEDKYKQRLREKERLSQALVARHKQALDEADLYLQEMERRKQIRQKIYGKASKEKLALENYRKHEAEIYKLRLRGYMRQDHKEESDV